MIVLNCKDTKKKLIWRKNRNCAPAIARGHPLKGCENQGAACKKTPNKVTKRYYFAAMKKKSRTFAIANKHSHKGEKSSLMR